ncbi:MAG: STAS domain-containing protein [Phycisphaeraceae bacterium]|nr:STAS domain-containing protein [Phycisphaeraceae bacterium]
MAISQPRPEAVVLSLTGEVDLERSPDLQVTLQEAFGLLRGKGAVVVDLSQVTYMDSSGVATLVRGLQLSRKKGVGLVLCSLQDRVRSIFEIARLDTVFPIASTLEEAIDTASAV